MVEQHNATTACDHGIGDDIRMTVDLVSIAAPAQATSVNQRLPQPASRSPTVVSPSQFRQRRLPPRHLECRRGELYCLQSEVALPTVAAAFVWHRIPWQDETRTGETT